VLNVCAAAELVREAFIWLPKVLRGGVKHLLSFLRADNFPAKGVILRIFALDLGLPVGVSRRLGIAVLLLILGMPGMLSRGEEEDAVSLLDMDAVYDMRRFISLLSVMGTDDLARNKSRLAGFIMILLLVANPGVLALEGVFFTGVR